MTLKRTFVECDSERYEVREVPAGFLRLHKDMTDPSAQIDMLAICVLDKEGKPIGEAVDEEIPLRHLENLLEAILELSGFGDPKPDAAA